MDFLIESVTRRALEFLEPALLAGEMNPGEDVRPDLDLGVEKRSLLFDFSRRKVQETDRDHRRPEVHGKTTNRFAAVGGKRSTRCQLNAPM